MARETLPTALALMFGHEGGYSAAKTDSGNFLNGVLVGTKYGVTGKTLAAHRGVKTVTAADVRGMTADEAEAIYRKSYWTQSGGDLLPVGLDYAAFDFGVNSGPARAVKSLQRVLGVAQDGIVGVQTAAAVKAFPGGLLALIKAYCSERMRYLRTLGGKTGFGPNGRGWTIRVTGIDPEGKWKPQPGVVGNALRLATQEQPVQPAPVMVPDGKANPADKSIIETIKKPEAWAPLGGLVTSLGALASGNGPLQWALALVLVAGVVYGIYRLVQRDRAEA